MTGDPVLGGKADDELIIRIIRHISRTSRIEPMFIIKEPFLVLHDGNVELHEVRIVDKPPEGAIIHHPDIVLLNRANLKPCLIIEVDGSWHDTKAGARKTEKRNKHYTEYGLKYHIVTPKNWMKKLPRDLHGEVYRC